MKNLIKKVKDFLMWQPLTARSLVSLLISYLAITYYSTPNSDLVVDVLAKSILFLGTLLIVASLLLRINLKSKMRVECNFDQKNNFSNSPISSSITISNFSIPLFFSLEIKRVFDRGNISSPIHIIRGNFLNETKYLIDTVQTTHRGIWKLTKLRYKFSDNFGFTSYSWFKDVENYLQVNVKNIDIAPLPLIASSSSSGDEISLNKDLTGDLFDLKPYDPSDGTKRILWKTYAKSGQLISRKPEPASIPEGEVAIFLIASKEEDYVAATAQSYIEQLAEKNITILFGTDGFNLDNNLSFTTQKEEIYKAIVNTVWHQDNGSGNGITEFIKSLLNNSKFLQNVIIFTSENQQIINNVTNVCSSFQLKSFIVSVPSSFNPSNTQVKQKNSLVSKLTKIMFKNQKPNSEFGFMPSTSQNYEIIQPQRRY